MLPEAALYFDRMCVEVVAGRATTSTRKEGTYRTAYLHLMYTDRACGSTVPNCFRYSAVGASRQQPNIIDKKVQLYRHHTDDKAVIARTAIMNKMLYLTIAGLPH